MFGNIPDWIEDEDLADPVMWEIHEWHCTLCNWTLVARTTFEEDCTPIIDTHIRGHAETLIEQVTLDFQIRQSILRGMGQAEAGLATPYDLDDEN